MSSFIIGYLFIGALLSGMFLFSGSYRIHIENKYLESLDPFIISLILFIKFMILWPKILYNLRKK